MTTNNIKQRGAVSIFIVVFTALLITVVTIGFVGIMVQNQQQATTTDLSQSAYDSAQVGVEDAKRALIYYQNVCGGSDVTNCTQAVKNAFALNAKCNDPVETLSDVTAVGGEVKVQTNGVNNVLDQAYTCVKIDLQTDDYIGTLGQDSSKFIPLIGVSDFNTIRIEWFSVKDLQGTTTSVDVPLFNAGTPLLNQASWTSIASLNRPSIMRAQLIQFNPSGFILSDLDNNSVNASNNTLFLYPTNIANSSKAFASDVRKTTKDIAQINCSSSLASLIYSCSATITLPTTVRVGDLTTYLNLTSIYKKTNYRIALSNSGLPCDPATRIGAGCVKFNAVQPSIDSTGRANDLFRRVQTRVELIDANFPYPEAAVDLAGSLCKDFSITDNVVDYRDSVVNGLCTP